MLAQVLLSLSLIACARWETEDPSSPRCIADVEPTTRVSFSASAVYAAPTTSGFVLRLGGFEQSLHLGSFDLDKRSGWQWALVRVDAGLGVIESVRLTDIGPGAGAPIVSAGDAVFSESQMSGEAATVSRLAPGWTPEWTFSTRPLLDSLLRGMAASPATLAHVYRTPGLNGEKHVELLDAVAGTLLWDVAIGPDFDDLAVDRDGNAIVAARIANMVAITRIARSDGSVARFVDVPYGVPRVQGAGTGFFVLLTLSTTTLRAYDAAGVQGWSVDLGTPTLDSKLVAFANGDALVSIPGADASVTLFHVTQDGAIASTQRVCAPTLLGVDAMGHALLASDDELMVVSYL